MKRTCGVTGFGLILLAASMAAGCSKSGGSLGNAPGAAASANALSAAAAPATNDQTAITQAIQEHLTENKSLNMAAMDMNVTGVNIAGDQAQANAEFRVKQGGASMRITYFLERHAGGWIVVRSQPGGGQFSHPPMDKTHSGMANSTPPQGGIPNVNDFLNGGSPANASGAASHSQ